MTSLLKKKKQFFFKLQTQRLTESFEGLNSALAQSTSKLGSLKVAQKYQFMQGF